MARGAELGWVLVMSAATVGLGIMAASCDGGGEGEAEVALARTCVRERVDVASGVVSETLTEVFDDAGRLVSSQLVDAEHTWDATATRSYDADGRLVAEAASDAGPLGGAFSRAYRYDAAGRLVAVTLSGEVTEFWARSLELMYQDGLDAPLRVEITTGYERVVDTYSYDAAGRPTARLRESTGVGAAAPEVTRDTYVWDADGALVEARQDRGADDTVEAIVRWARDGAGRLVSVGSYDPGGDLVEGTTFTWQGARLVGKRWDSTLDGVERVSYDYDAAGEVVAASLAYGADGPASSQVQIAGGRPGARCVASVSESLRAPVDRFYADPAERWLYGTPGGDAP